MFARLITAPANRQINTNFVTMNHHGAEKAALWDGLAPEVQEQFLRREEQMKAGFDKIKGDLSLTGATKLPAGASWMAEYGDPDDPEDWEFIAEYSPYQNVSGERAYPPVLITTSTRDDRVHPGHARKMTAALEAAGQPVWYYENIEGGHGGAADNAQRADLQALEFAFLWQRLAPRARHAPGL